jgi:hypothetical protein
MFLAHVANLGKELRSVDIAIAAPVFLTTRCTSVGSFSIAKNIGKTRQLNGASLGLIQ